MAEFRKNLLNAMAQVFPLLKEPLSSTYPTPRNGPETDRNRPEMDRNQLRVGRPGGFVGLPGGGVLREKERH